jgi:hypothetical protein
LNKKTQEKLQYWFMMKNKLDRAKKQLEKNLFLSNHDDDERIDELAGACIGAVTQQRSSISHHPFDPVLIGPFFVFTCAVAADVVDVHRDPHADHPDPDLDGAVDDPHDDDDHHRFPLADPERLSDPFCRWSVSAVRAALSDPTTTHTHWRAEPSKVCPIARV